MGGFERMQAQLVAALTNHLKRPNTPPKVPEAGLLLWQAFIELDMARAFHAEGPCPIAYSEIQAWADLHRWPLESRHIAVIKALDLAMLKHLNEAAIARAKAGGKLRKSITPALFDAGLG